jgi:hypothetical protein
MEKDSTQQTIQEKEEPKQIEKTVINTARPQSKHLIPWKPGEVVNPDGRPKGQKNYATLYREALLKIANAKGTTPDLLELEIISKGLFKARKGDYKFYKDLLDRLFGQATQNTESKNLNINVDIKPDEDPEITALRKQYNDKVKDKLIKQLLNE